MCVQAICALVLTAVSPAAKESALPPLKTPGAQVRLDAALAAYAKGSTELKSGLTEQGKATLEAASLELEQLAELEPHAWVLYALGQTRRRLQDCEHAIAAYRRALELVPGEALPSAAATELTTRTQQQIAVCVVEQPALAAKPRPSDAPQVAPAPAALQPAPPARAPEAVVVSQPAPSRADAAGITLTAAGLAFALSGAALFGHAESLTQAQAASLQGFENARAASTERLVAGLAVGAGSAVLIAAGIRWFFVLTRESR